MDLQNLTKEKIKSLDYNQLIGIVKETNRPPGGKETVSRMAQACFINKETKVLEIGTSTGFTAIELSRLASCNITAIDINSDSLEEAKKRADAEGYLNIKFEKADVNALPYKNNAFDVVIVGNVLSLMGDKQNAFDECRRVCKKDGFIISIPMYYIREPSEKLVKDVSEAIQVNITPLYEKDWIKFLSSQHGLTLSIHSKYKFDYIEDSTIKKFVEQILARPHLQSLSKEAFDALRETYTNFIYLFRDNLSHMGYCIISLSEIRKWEDPELFTGTKIE